MMADLPVLIYSYIYAELVQKHKICLRIQASKEEFLKKEFLKNALNLSGHFFGKEHYFTKKILRIQNRIGQIYSINELIGIENINQEQFFKECSFEFDMNQINQYKIFLNFKKNNFQNVNFMVNSARSFPENIKKNSNFNQENNEFKK